ncbi:MAG: hypothetical protein HY067_06450 [Betaproteobacteria bacterium]|nr:hypothetical protein [Betaproteobacteria bacterium]
MAAKLLLCVSNDQATVAVWRRRRLLSCTRFENNEGGWIAFGNFLRGAHGLPIHIIVDTVEEDFRFETLPHIRGRDRTEMVGRKLKQLYRATPYYSYALQERETGKRRDDRYLFAALTNPDLLIPWLRAIEAAGLPVSGIYPLALVSVSLIDRLKLKHPNLLIITKDNAGLRQTFFKNLKFRISRLTPLRGAADAADQHYADEIGNTRMYLDALTVTHVDDTLEIVILDQNGSLSSLPSAIMRGRPNVQCQYLDIKDIHSRFGIPVADLEASTDVLHLHLLGEQAPTLNLAPPHLTRTYQRFAAGRWVYAASGATLVGAVIWSGANVYQAMGIDQNALAVQQQTRDYQVKYQQVTAEFPDAPTTADNLRHTVEIAEQIRTGLRTPETMFSIVSHALDASPDIQLQRIEWHYGDSLASKPGMKPTQTLPTEPGKLIQSGVVYGEVTRFEGDYRAAMNAINNFLQRIAQDNAVAEVKALKLPLDVRSESGLNGSTAALPGKETAQFEIAVVFRNGA